MLPIHLLRFMFQQIIEGSIKILEHISSTNKSDRWLALTAKPKRWICFLCTFLIN